MEKNTKCTSGYFHVIDTEGNLVVACGVKIVQDHGREYYLLLEGGSRGGRFVIGFSAPGKGILPDVQNYITTKVGAGQWFIDLRHVYRYNPEPFQFGCTILPKKS